jgi:hypothetical protein
VGDQSHAQRKVPVLAVVLEMAHVWLQGLWNMRSIVSGFLEAGSARESGLLLWLAYGAD